MENPLGVFNQKNPRGVVANYRTSGLADLAVAIQTGRDARCSVERPLHGVEVMTAMLRSAETRQTLKLQAICTQPGPLTAEEAQLFLRRVRLSEVFLEGSQVEFMSPGTTWLLVRGEVGVGDIVQLQRPPPHRVARLVPRPGYVFGHR